MEECVHIMLDFETAGTDAPAAPGSVGLVKFNPLATQTIDQIRNLPCKLLFCDLEDAVNNGFKINTNTLDFWAKQPDGMMQRCLLGPPGERKSVVSFASAIRKFVNDMAYELPYCVWVKGADFDGLILRHLQKAIPHHFAYNCIRDVRTLFDVAFGTTKPKFPEVDIVAHNPLEDCFFQIYATQQALRAIGR